MLKYSHTHGLRYRANLTSVALCLLLLSGCAGTSVHRNEPLPPSEQLAGKDVSFTTLGGDKAEEAKFVALESDTLLYEVENATQKVPTESLAVFTKLAGSGTEIGAFMGVAAGVLIVTATWEDRKDGLDGLLNGPLKVFAYGLISLGGAGVGALIGGASDPHEEYRLVREVAIPVSEEALTGDVFSIPWGDRTVRVPRHSVQIQRDSIATRVVVPLELLLR